MYKTQLSNKLHSMHATVKNCLPTQKMYTFDPKPRFDQKITAFKESDVFAYTFHENSKSRGIEHFFKILYDLY